MQQEHRSPDGTLKLVVSREDDDFTIGFDGFEWHTHGDMLAAGYSFAGVTGLTPEGASQRFVQEIVSNRAVIAVSRLGNRVQDVWVTDDVEKQLRYKKANEEIEFRYWNGTDARRSVVCHGVAADTLPPKI